MSIFRPHLRIAKAIIGIVILLLVLNISGPKASAHALSASYTNVVFDKDKTDFTFSLDTISVLENMDIDTNNNGIIEPDELKANEHKLEEWIGDSVVLEMNDREQPGELVDLKLGKKRDMEVVTWHYAYPAFETGQTVSINDGLYSAPSGSAYVNLITSHNGDQVSESVLQGKDRTWSMLLTEQQQEQQLPESSVVQPAQTSSEPKDFAHEPASSTAPSGWFSFFKLGMNHILTGYDHLLFLFALLLRKQSFKQYASIITAFTLAHSITLTLAVLGWISLPSRIVESVIALSICYVALENIFRKEIRYRAVITFLFGLIHGIGFSDILREMGLPKSHLAVDLISFNLGIECIQLCIVLILLPVLIFIQKKNFFKPALMYGSFAITAMGAFWLVERLFF